MKDFTDIYSEEDDEMISLGSPDPMDTITGQNGKNGKIVLCHKIGSSGGIEGSLDGSGARAQKVVTVQIDAQNGSVQLCNRYGTEAIHLDASEADMYLGGGLQDGGIRMSDGSGNETIHLNAGEAKILLGGNGVDGDVKLSNKEGNQTIRLAASEANILLGGNGVDGDIRLSNKEGTKTIQLNADQANMVLGGEDANGDISLRNKYDVETISIEGSSGDIKFRNADIAEEFTVCNQFLVAVTPGTVVSMTNDGLLEPCKVEYDSAVLGVVAGAGNYQPGLVLDSSGEKNRVPIAVIGKVFCKADADLSPIRPGDLLTTSASVGFATKVTDKSRAFGAVIGKAMGSLDHGKGLIPVLINLQ